MKRFVCIKQFDPCYGMKIIRVGQHIDIDELIEGDIRVRRCDNGDTYPGWGMRIFKNELNTHFRLANTTESK